MLYVAVVKRRGEEVSRREQGDWACFTAKTKGAAIRSALRAAGLWKAADYEVVVGRLTEKAVPSPDYQMERLED